MDAHSGAWEQGTSPAACSKFSTPCTREIWRYYRVIAVPLVCSGESLRLALDNLDSKNFYAINPGFDKKQAKALMSKNQKYR